MFGIETIEHHWIVFLANLNLLLLSNVNAHQNLKLNFYEASDSIRDQAAISREKTAFILISNSLQQDSFQLSTNHVFICNLIKPFRLLLDMKLSKTRHINNSKRFLQAPEKRRYINALLHYSTLKTR